MTGYREWSPAGLVGGLLECAWQARTGPGGPHEQRVLPDGCMDLLVLDGRLVVAGPDTAAHVGTSPPGSVLTGLRFRPGALPALLGVPADALRNQRVDLADVLGPAEMRVSVHRAAGDDRGAHLGAAWSAAAGAHGASDRGVSVGARGVSAGARGVSAGARGVSAGARGVSAGARGASAGDREVSAGALDATELPDTTEPLDALLLLDAASRLAAAATYRRRPLPTPLPRGALRALARGASTADVADRLGVTTRTLHRTSVATIGYGPSVVRRVLRFRAAAALLYEGTPPAEVAARTRYADQPHLSREVRAMAGVSPTALGPG